ncbi:ATPase [Clostridia bacterium]|nr:ATPase [Clostridia bacterium]
MFETFYHFSKTPFARNLPPENLYKGNDTEELIERLNYAAHRQLFAVIIGDCGTGKTTALRRFREELKNSKFRTLYVDESKLTPRMFYKILLEQLGFEAKYHCSDAKRQLHREVEIMRGVEGVMPVVIVDEAHLLPKETIEEIRFLLNCQMDSESPMALILSGQVELWDKLKLQSYTAIRQRVDIHCIVGRLDRAQTAAYISAHMTYAGAEKEIFTDAALDAIFKFSAGTPRDINKVCTETLIYGAQNRKQLIDDHMVKLVIEQERNSGDVK